MGINAWLERNLRHGTWLDMVLGGLLVVALFSFLSVINIEFVNWRGTRLISPARYNTKILLDTFYIGVPVAIAAAIAGAWSINKLSLQKPWPLLWICLLAWVLLRTQASQWIGLGLYPGNASSESAATIVSVSGLLKVFAFLLPLNLVALLRLWQPVTFWMCLAICCCQATSTRLFNETLWGSGVSLTSSQLTQTSMLVLWFVQDYFLMTINFACVCLMSFVITQRAIRFRLTLSIGLSLLLSLVYIVITQLSMNAGDMTLARELNRLFASATEVILFTAVFHLVLGTQSHQRTQYDVSANMAAIDLRLTESRLRVLQAQLEPHFLFNTLANVKRLYQTMPQEGSALLGSLLAYFRVALPKLRSDCATLGDELQLVSAYLAILQQRMGERLQVTVKAPAELLTLPFPPMMLLTLVENAIKHGLMPLPQGGALHIYAQTANNDLEVSVADTGKGFDTKPSGGSGVGLANVRERLRALFGSNAKLELQPLQPSGVRALIAIDLLSLSNNAKTRNTINKGAPNTITLNENAKHNESIIAA
jgi:signal transduction histidine kinase